MSISNNDFLKNKNKEWKEFDKEFFNRYQELIFKENDFDELINMRTTLFDNIYCADFETETKHSKAFLDYYNKTGRTRCRVNYFFMVNLAILRRDNFANFIDKDDIKYMVEGNSISQLLDYFYNKSTITNDYIIFFHNVSFDGLWIKQYLDKNNFILLNQKGNTLNQFKKDKEKFKKSLKIHKQNNISLNILLRDNLISIPKLNNNCYYVTYHQGKISGIKIYMKNYRDEIISISINCSFKLLSQGSSIDNLAKAFKLYKKDKSIASKENYEKFLAKSYQNNIEDIYKEDCRYPFYCKRDVFIQMFGIISLYYTIYTLLKHQDKYNCKCDNPKKCVCKKRQLLSNATFLIIKNDMTISKVSIDTAKAVLSKEQAKYLNVSIDKRMIFDRETKGGLTNFNLDNDIILFHKHYIDKMEHKNIGCDDIKSAYPHKLIYTPTGKVFINEPDDYKENPNKYGVMYEIGYKNMKPKNPNARIGILKDYLISSIYLMKEWLNKSTFNECYKEMYNYKIDNINSEFNGWYLFRNMLKHYGIESVDFNISTEKFLSMYKDKNKVVKIGKLIYSCDKYFTYGTTDYINQIERFYNYDEKIIYSKYYFELDDYLSKLMYEEFALKENGKGAVKQMIKIMINSLYGKTAQGYIFPLIVANNNEIDIYEKDDNVYCKFNNIDSKVEYQITSKITDKTKHYSSQVEQYVAYSTTPLIKKNLTNKLIANWCTNQTQAQVLKAIIDNGVENHIYCDTDSRIYINNDISKLVHSKELGGWENEFLVEFVKVDGYDGYCCKLYKNDKIKVDNTTYRIIEETDKYYIFDKYYIMVSIAIRQKTYYFGLLDLKNIKFDKYDCDTLLDIINSNNKNKWLNDSDIKYIISFLVDGYECKDTGNFITKHLMIKKAHSGIKLIPSQCELFTLLVKGNMNVINKNMVEILCDDGGCYLEWNDKIIDINRTIESIDGYDMVTNKVLKKEQEWIDVTTLYNDWNDIYVKKMFEWTTEQLKTYITQHNNVLTLTNIFQGDEVADGKPKDTTKIFKK